MDIAPDARGHADTGDVVLTNLIWLIDFDGKIENLALMKLSTYHKQLGDVVILKRGLAYPELFETPDKVYISCLFSWNKDAALILYYAWNDKAEIGGTGIDPTIKLPAHIELLPPDYSLYGKNRAVGFISRGCPRKCPWCVVPKKEGNIHRVSSASEIVGDRDEAIFFDNNFLALPDYYTDLEWLANHRIRIDFNQANDARLINKDNAELLAACNWYANGSTIRISLDTIGAIPAVKKALLLLSDAGMSLSRIFVFCLIGFDGLESDIERLLFLRNFDVSIFPMGYRDIETGDEPARGWDRKLYKKYRRLICRLPHAKSVWDDFEREVIGRQ